jgi:hypothetical protein
MAPRRQRLKRHIDANRYSGGFTDLRSAGSTVGVAKDAQQFIARYHGRVEYWFADTLFTMIAGGLSEARALKKESATKGLIEVGEGKRISFVVKREVPGIGRQWFVVIKHSPEGPRPARALTVEVMIVGGACRGRE